MTPIQQMFLGAGGGSDIIQTGLNQWFDFGDSSCYTHPASNLTGYDPTYVGDLSGNNNDARLFFYRGGTSQNWGVNFDSSLGGHLDFPNTTSYSGQTNISQSFFVIQMFLIM